MSSLITLLLCLLYIGETASLIFRQFNQQCKHRKDGNRGSAGEFSQVNADC